jgi:hypothetical protein
MKSIVSWVITCPHRQRQYPRCVVGGRAFQLFEPGAISRACGPSLGCLDQRPPIIAPRAGSGEELVDPPFLSFLRDRRLPVFGLIGQQ